MPTAWKGTISFGLVNIPITLYPAFKSRDLEFHLLHRPDHGRIGYRKFCKKCGKTLEPGEIVKAYEHEKDAFVPLEQEDLEQGQAPDTRNLQISLFVKESEIDTKLYERPYYVMPAKNAEGLYVLLREAIRSSGMIGVGRIRFGAKEHLAALKADGPAILLNLMHFLEELEDPNLLKFPAEDAAVGKKELDLARQLVASLEGRFEPEEFQDTRRARLEEAIRGKVEEDLGKAAAIGRDRKVIDLMERLRASLEGGGRGAAPPPKAKAGSRGKPASRAARDGRHEDGKEHAERHYRRKKAG